MALPAVANADAGACQPAAGSPRCSFSYGKTTFVADGDTIDVDIDGDGTRTPRPIRLTGINAMELHRYSKYADRRRGDCHGLEATARLQQLLHQGHMRVRLAAQDPGSHAGHRLRRQVSTRIGGQWVDTGRVLMSEGYALWLPNGHEWAWNRDYHGLADAAAAQRLQLYNPVSCGAGPGAPDGVSVTVNYDAPHNDRRNVDGEWMLVTNRSAAPLDFGGWWLRDSALRRFTIPAGTVLAPRQSLTVHVGHGVNFGANLFWGLDAPAFENPTYDQRGLGDGAYLFDPQGDLRASAIY
jgi:micrococcal nuclease